MHPKIPHSLHKKELLLRYQEHTQQQQILQEQALTEAARLAHVLVEQFGAATVYLFGPLTYGKFSEGMPIALAVEGISPETFARALGHLKHFSQFDVELMNIAAADSWSKRAIGEKGRLLAQKGEGEKSR